MKKIYAFLMMAATLAACMQMEQPMPIEEQETPKEQEQTVQTYTMTVEATKSGDKDTKALSLSGKTLNATWAKGEAVTVYNVTRSTALDGTLIAQSSGTSTTLKGTLTGSIQNGDQLKLKFLSPSYGTQDGTLTGSATSIDKVCDYAEATVTVTSVSGTNITASNADFENQQAIVKFTLKHKADNSNLVIPAGTALTVNDGTHNYTVTPASATNELFVAIPATGTVNLSTTIGGIDYSYNKSGANLVAGKYYEISVKLVRGTVNLARVTGDTTLRNGDVVTGTFAKYYEPYKISIADGATVTLDGVDINSYGWPSGYYAGVTCLGDATIILKEGTTNTVKGFSTSYPGIYVPSGKTLTIQGTGTLNASSNGSSYGAGIGGGLNIPNGDIVINSGTITATSGGDYSAGIGGGYQSSCGAITINGGTVTATGGREAAGIGGGYNSSYGDITISGGTVTATGGENAAGIGSGGYVSSCGDITISGGTVTATGGQDGAGIGSGAYSSSCGDITINGGTVEATGSGSSAGIGGGSYSPCSVITIENTVTSVTATKGEYASNSIGKSRQYYACGTVTIGGTVYYDGSSYKNDGEEYLSTSPLVFAPTPSTPSGALAGLFSVSDTKQVYFSQGNLKYSNGTWSFHDNQYDMCFNSEDDVSAQYNENGTFDLFGWGTSGYDAKYPYLTSSDEIDYYNENIARTNYDWGTNAISNGGNTPNSGWRTLTRDEWQNLLNDRYTESNVRYAKATVNGVEGLIIFPDDWSTSYYAINHYNEFYYDYNDESYYVYYSDNVISSSDWTSTLEAHGAVFLPVFGFRAGTYLISGMESRYWSSTYYQEEHEWGANCLTLMEDKDFGYCYLSALDYAPTSLGAFVRLVKDAN